MSVALKHTPHTSSPGVLRGRSYRRCTDTFCVSRASDMCDGSHNTDLECNPRLSCSSVTVSALLGTSLLLLSSLYTAPRILCCRPPQHCVYQHPLLHLLYCEPRPAYRLELPCRSHGLAPLVVFAVPPLASYPSIYGPALSRDPVYGRSTVVFESMVYGEPLLFLNS